MSFASFFTLARFAGEGRVRALCVRATRYFEVGHEVRKLRLLISSLNFVLFVSFVVRRVFLLRPRGLGAVKELGVLLPRSRRDPRGAKIFFHVSDLFHAYQRAGDSRS